MKDKVRATDLSIKELPHTRFEVFKDLIKTQKRALFSLSMLVFVFFLPFVVDILLFGQFIVIAGNSTADATQRASTVFSLIFYMMIIGIPCNMVAFVGLGGLAEACKSLVWQEGLLIGPVFFKGIKKSFKTSLFFGFLMGLSLFLLVVGIFFLLRTAPNQSMQWLNGIGIGLCIVQFVVLSIISAYSLTLSVYYSLSIRATFKNGWIFFVLGFFKNLLLFLVTIALPVGIMFLGFIGQIVSIALILVFSSLFMVCWTLVSHKLFDKYINAQNYPEFVDKGLYKEIVKED